MYHEGRINLPEQSEAGSSEIGLPISRVALRSAVASWRSDGDGEDDWWQDVIGSDGEVYDVNIFDSAVSGHGPDVGFVYCIYATRETADGFRETEVTNILQREPISSLDVNQLGENLRERES